MSEHSAEKDALARAWAEGYAAAEADARARIETPSQEPYPARARNPYYVAPPAANP